MGALKDFLETESQPVEEMTVDDMQQVIAGYRATIALVPLEVMEWMLQLNEPVRLINRKYEVKAGILTAIKFDVSEYSVYCLEPSFDAVRGVRLIEQKVITIPQDAVLYTEAVEWSRDYEDWHTEQELGEMSLDVR